MNEDSRVISVEIVGEANPESGGFLRMVRFRYRNVYLDGGRSRPYLYEYIHRKGFDSVAIALYHEEDGFPAMAFRDGIRVPVYFRKELDLPIPDTRKYLFIPEAVAGSMEPEDKGVEGLRRRVVAEVLEEAGFIIKAEQVHPLGGGFFPSHGQSSEKIHLAAARVCPAERVRAEGDGSVNESDAPPVKFMPVSDILKACCASEIEDPKVEILAGRLALYLGYLPLFGRYATPEERELLAPLKSAMETAGWNRRST